MITRELELILDKASRRQTLTKDEVKYILAFDETSYESGLIRNLSNTLVREKNDNTAIIIGQVGTDIHPCEAKCGFCSFGEGHTSVPTFKISKPALKKAIDDFCKEGDLYGLYLMTMADTDQKYLLDMVSYAREVAPAETQIWVNTGDNELGFYRELLKAGAVGAYHVCRVGEGVNTKLEPEKRLKTMYTIKEAGLDLFSCCEPIGPETTVDEMADAICNCLDMNVTQFGAMKRVAVPGTPLGALGEISNLKMAHVMGCVGLAYASVGSARFFGVHEPCDCGYISGANFVIAETGANPRDT
ncbi:MAG: hypothetical protein PHS19_05935, partial [Eubacteriales bacterium]|nr:hypothetical protein [Eubacteriales bacterium]